MSLNDLPIYHRGIPLHHCPHLSLQLCFAERTTSHGPSGPTRCHTCQDHPCLPVKRRRGSTTCTHNATTFRERRHLGTHTHGSLHASGRGCASREGHTNTLPALPLRAAQRDKRGRRTHAAAPQQHGAPIPSRTARTNWRSSPKVIPKRRLLVRQNSTFLVPGSGTTCEIQSTSNFQGANPGIRNCSDSTNSAHAAKRPKPRYLPLQRRKTEGFAIPP